VERFCRPSEVTVFSDDCEVFKIAEFHADNRNSLPEESGIIVLNCPGCQSSVAQWATSLNQEGRMRRLFLLAVATVTTSCTVAAADQIGLHGTYAFTGTAVCIQDSASLGFNPNLTPAGPTTFYSFSIEGTRTFHGDGTGTVKARSLSINAPSNAAASSSDLSFQFTYTIDHSILSTSMVPGTFSGTVLTGPRAGQTFVGDIPTQVGFIGEDAKTIVLSQPAPVVEINNFSNGDNFLRICNRSRTLIRLH
jgi:hypothetical protein